MGASLASAGLRGLYAIIDPSQCGSRGALAVADAVLAGGCAVMQLRDKQHSDAELLPLARALGERCRTADVPFVVNDRPRLAVDVGAWGVHLGQQDISLEHARTCAAALRIGLSTHDLSQARDAERRGADLIGFGPVFPTRSKQAPDPVVGLSALREVCKTVSIPVVAIGGINASNVADVASTGVSMVAVISAVCCADDPASAASSLHRLFGG